MKKSNPAIAADNAAKLFRWMQQKRMSVPEGVEMMVMSLAITTKKLADEQPDADVGELTDSICDMIKGTVGNLRKIFPNEAA